MGVPPVSGTWASVLEVPEVPVEAPAPTLEVSVLELPEVSVAAPAPALEVSVPVLAVAGPGTRSELEAGVAGCCWPGQVATLGSQ
jgi:hypothetical protein